MVGSGKPVAYNDSSLISAVDCLRQGGLVAFPTETVYGLGADASNPNAVEKIFLAKQRPADHPLIVHIGALDMLDAWAETVPDTALALAKAFWPGPLAIILPKHQQVSTLVTGGQSTVALRMPDHPVAMALLNKFQGGLAAPSANRFKHISPTRAEHVVEELGGMVDIILDGGECPVGIESTIIDLSRGTPIILRPGEITALQIEQVLQQSVSVWQFDNIRAPGMMDIHYAPTTQAFLCEQHVIQEWIEKAKTEEFQLAVLIYSDSFADNENVTIRKLSNQVKAYSHDLYAALRELDALKPERILIEITPQNETWQAVNDRLSKAAAVIKD